MPVRFDKRNPFPSTILENIRSVGRHSSKETRHLELSLEESVSLKFNIKS